LVEKRGTVMKKTTNKKLLTLSAETIRGLTLAELGTAQGGCGGPGSSKLSGRTQCTFCGPTTV
jgi:hypothetical protein